MEHQNATHKKKSGCTTYAICVAICSVVIFAFKIGGAHPELLKITDYVLNLAAESFGGGLVAGLCLYGIIYILTKVFKKST
jgi:hypothetical protein